MTKVTIYNGDDYHMISAIGHATGDERVCAGISAVLYSLAGWLTNFAEPGKRVIFMESGDAVLASLEGDEATKAAFDVAIIGLLQIEKGNQHYILCQVVENDEEAKKISPFS